MPLHPIQPTARIEEILKRKTRNNWVGGMKFLRGGDREYWLPRNADVPAILARSRISHEGSRGDVFDCDDYAIAMKARISYAALRTNSTGGRPIASGIFWGRASWAPDPQHAGNWFLTREGGLKWIEPQYNNSQAAADGKTAIRPRGNRVTHLDLILF